MTRSIIVKIHAAGSVLSLLLIATFFVSTVVVEIVGDVSSIQLIKQLIVYGIGILIPMMAVTGLSGNKLAGKSSARSIQLKKNRMKRIMILGLTVLVPAAFILNYLAQVHSIGIVFYSVQMIELMAGGTNIILMGKNMKEGLILSGRLQRKQSFV